MIIPDNVIIHHLVSSISKKIGNLDLSGYENDCLLVQHPKEKLLMANLE